MEDNASDDLFLKYQKLASEYSKMRAQNTVLKRAVTEEQGKSQELKDRVKEKDQSVRKMELEIESLNFRNQQLTKRVSILQDELANNVHNNTSLKKSKGKSPSNHSIGNNSVDSSVVDILDAELKNKIAENEKLHLQIHTIEVEYQRKCEEVQQQVDLLREENAAKQKSINESLESQKIVIDKLAKEKEKIEAKLNKCLRDLQEAQILNDNLDFEAKNLHSKVKIFEASKKLTQNTFDDNKKAVFIGLNLPSVLKSNLVNIRKFLADFKMKFIETLHALSNLHTYMEQRINICSSDISDSEHLKMLKEFESHLHGNAQYLRKIQESFDKLYQKVLHNDLSLVVIKSSENLNIVVNNFSSYVQYISKMIPFLVFSLSIHNPIGGETGEKIFQKNEKLKECAIRCAECFSQLDNYFKQIVSHTSPIDVSLALKDLLQYLNDLHSSFDDVKRAYSAKLVIEHELPTLTERVKNTDDCLLSSIVVLVNATAELCTLFGTNYQLLTEVHSLFKVRGKSTEPVEINPAVIKLKERASNYLTQTLELQKYPPPTVAYEKAIANEQLIQDSAESKENLTRQLAAVESKLANLEQAKEHWMLEAQILQVKYEREMKKVQELEAKATIAGLTQNFGQSTSTSTPSGSQRSIEVNCAEFASSLQSPSISDDKISIGSITNTDDEAPQVTAYLRNRIAQLIDNLHSSDSKSVAFHAECVCLQQRLAIIDKEKKSLEENLMTSRKSIQELNEELETKSKNYEEQLSMMSEHLANMNDKVVTQKDEIDSLKLQSTNNKSNSRRSRNK